MLAEAPDAPDGPRVMVFTDHSEDVTTDKDGKKREVHRIVIRRDGDGAGKAPTVMFAPADGKDKLRRIDVRMPGSLSRDDVLATLKEQGVTGKRAEAIADKLEAKRKERLRTVLAPMPPDAAHAAWRLVVGAWSDDGARQVRRQQKGGADRQPRRN